MDQYAELARSWSGGCSCFNWFTEDGKHLWGRNFDFDRLAQGTAVTYLPAGTNYFPAGRERGMEQSSRYAAAGIGTLLIPGTPVLFEGINEKGLMGGQLYYREFAWYDPTPAFGRIPLSPPFVVIHLLSQCASVAEAARILEKDISLAAVPVLGTVPPLHWAFADRTGEMIIAEPDRDGLHIYRHTLGVMTNSPGYPWHRTNLLNYSGICQEDRGEMTMGEESLRPCFSGSGAQGLPGDWSSPSRFVRLAFLRQYCVPGAEEGEGIIRLFRMLQSAAFPLGMVRVPETKAADYDTEVVPYDYTIYSCAACAESLRFYWTTYQDPRPRYVDLNHLSKQTEPAQFELGGAPEFLSLSS